MCWYYLLQIILQTLIWTMFLREEALKDIGIDLVSLETLEVGIPNLEM